MADHEFRAFLRKLGVESEPKIEVPGNLRRCMAHSTRHPVPSVDPTGDWIAELKQKYPELEEQHPHLLKGKGFVFCRYLIHRGLICLGEGFAKGQET